MNSGQNVENLTVERCLYCGQPKSIVWVHGHGQCVHCGINVDECCRGESCDTVPVPVQHSKDNYTGSIHP